MPTPAIHHDVALDSMNSFGVAARAALFAKVTSLDELRALREQPAWGSGPALVLGGGSNLLLTRDIDDLVVAVAVRGVALAGEDADAYYVRAGAGDNWDKIVRLTIAAGWPGLENLALIPGTVGAAPIQNIGAYGVELAERFESLEAFDVERRSVVTLSAAECKFGYRDSAFKHALQGRMIITAVTFRLPKAWKPMLDYPALRNALAEQNIATPDAKEIADTVSAIRRSKLPDPAMIGNAGSFFKNPIVPALQFATLVEREPEIVAYPQSSGQMKLAAAWMIERCGWKGRSLAGASGRAAVHDRQPLVLVNRGGATGREILELAAAVKAGVAERFGVMLEPEPVIV